MNVKIMIVEYIRSDRFTNNVLPGVVIVAAIIRCFL